MRIFVFEEDPSLLSLMTLYLGNLGHKVHGFSGQYSCPLYQLEECFCPADIPCAEAVIVNMRFPDHGMVQMLTAQVAKGCKLPKLNKAVMSANLNEEQAQDLCDLGFTVIRKPFRLTSINDWLTGCEERLSVLK